MKYVILSILCIVFGILTIFMGVRDYPHKLLPEVLYFVLGSILIVLGVYKLFEITSYRNDHNEGA